MIGDRWGATDAEVARRYPCDDLVPRPAMQVWRAVTVEAAAGDLWPWVLQIRLAPYSYDWVDNLGRRSPQELRHLQDPLPGDPFTASAGRPLGKVLAVEHEVHLTAEVMGAVMSYVLDPEGDRTRLLLKVVTARHRWAAPLLSVGDLVMARRQLLNLKELAERPTAARRP